MKRYISFVTFFTLLFASFVLKSQESIESIFRRYKNDENVTSIKYQGDNLNKFLNKSKLKLKTSLDYVDIIGFDKNENLSEKDRLKIKEVLKKQKFEELINIRSKDGKVWINALSGPDNIQKIYGHFVSDTLGTYHVVLSGDIFLEEMGQIVSSLNLKELDFLNKVSAK